MNELLRGEHENKKDTNLFKKLNQKLRWRI